MKCPVCSTPDLLMSERQGIEIDYCPQCRGVWLDRGELDKIVQRSAQEFRQEAASAESRAVSTGSKPGGSGDEDDYRHRRRRKSFLEDLFD
ncbi:MAG TPA: zf-TFIIB domain-containing protein [Burkholderiales bacterium]|nr:zf-TFIIB domain-containing protein [Burkholderiales bacterium]